MKGIFFTYDNSNKEISRISANKLPYKKEKIIDFCVREFSDNDPCIIHETFCKNAFAIEIMEALNRINCGAEYVFSIDDCPTIISELISFPENVKFIKVI